MKIQLRDEVKEFESGVSVADIAKSISVIIFSRLIKFY